MGRLDGREDREEKEAMGEKEHHAGCVSPMPVERDGSLSGSSSLVRELGPPVRKRTLGVIWIAATNFNRLPFVPQMREAADAYTVYLRADFTRWNQLFHRFWC